MNVITASSYVGWTCRMRSSGSRRRPPSKSPSYCRCRKSTSARAKNGKQKNSNTHSGGSGSPTSRELVAYALNSLEEDPERSILLAMHAVAASWSHNQTTLPETEDTVHRALLASRIRVALSGHDG